MTLELAALAALHYFKSLNGRSPGFWAAKKGFSYIRRVHVSVVSNEFFKQLIMIIFSNKLITIAKGKIK